MPETPNVSQQGQDGGGVEGSSTENRTTVVENDKSPKGPLADLLNLEILPSPRSETSTVESGDSQDYYGPGEGQDG